MINSVRKTQATNNMCLAIFWLDNRISGSGSTVSRLLGLDQHFWALES